MNRWLNQVHHGDCLELMKQMPDGCVDLTVTSPPYDSLRSYKGYSFSFEGVAEGLLRITKQGGVVVWVVDDQKINGSESGMSLKQAIYFMNIGFNLHDKMIYQKINGAMGAHNEYLQEFEMMFVFSKGVPRTVNLLRDRKNVCSGKLRVPKVKSGIEGRKKETHLVELTDFGRRKNIWSYSVGGSQNIGYHPAVFPLQLAKDHILSWSNKEDIIYDPMAGSGTVAIAAHQTGRRWLVSEISEEYVEMARSRIKLETAQLSMFTQT